jgi:exopolysaccharide production protein ExoZ
VREWISFEMNLAAGAPKPSLIYNTLDAWRGFAAVWVVMIHACLPAIGTDYPQLANNPVFAFSLYARLALSMFFVISGYCIANAAAVARVKKGTMFYFVRARVRRVYPPYLIVSVFTVILSLGMSVLMRYGLFKGSAIAQLDFFHRGFWYYFSSITLTQILFRQTPMLIVFWSLCYEVGFYAIVALWLWGTLRAKKPNPLYYGLHAVTLISLAWIAFLSIPCLYPLDLWPEFGFGILAYHILSEPKRIWPKICFAAAVVLVVSYYLIYRDHSFTGQPTPTQRYLFDAGFALALIWLYPVDQKLSQWPIVRGLAWLGIFSYSIYLTHLLSLGIVSQIGKKLGVTEGTYWILFVFQVLTALIIARIFFTFFEKPFLSHRRDARIAVPVASPKPAPSTS